MRGGGPSKSVSKISILKSFARIHNRFSPGLKLVLAEVKNKSTRKYTFSYINGLFCLDFGYKSVKNATSYFEIA